MILKIKEAACLRLKSELCALTEGLRIGEDMVKFARKYNKLHTIKAMGLSAPQVGINKQVCITGYGKKWTIYVNPVIIEEAKETVNLEEGCLSLPGYYILVNRPKWIKISCLNHKEFIAENMAARVLCHEIDHLRGILISDYGDSNAISPNKYVQNSS